MLQVRKHGSTEEEIFKRFSGLYEREPSTLSVTTATQSSHDQAGINKGNTGVVSAQMTTGIN